MATASNQTVTSLDGKTTVDDKMVFEPERLSYQSADCLAAKISGSVCSDLKSKVVVIVGTPFLADLTNLQSVFVQLEALKRDYDALVALANQMMVNRSLPLQNGSLAQELDSTSTTAGAEATKDFMATAFNPVTAGISAALGLVSLFREDVEYKGIQTVVNPLAFELALADKVKKNGAERVYVPDMVVLPPTQNDASSLNGRLSAVQCAKSEVWTAIGPLVSELVKVDAELDRAMREKDQAGVDNMTRQLSSIRQDLDPITDQLRRADLRLSDLLTAWDKVDESTGMTILARLLRAEGVKALKPSFLHAQVVSSGGHCRTTRSLLRMIFTGDGLSFMGGATARWALLEDDGSVLRGGIVSERFWDRSQTMTSKTYPTTP
jgi:hypothetical protein